jgi:hypothetical protein
VDAVGIGVGASCIKARTCLSTHQSGEAGPSDTLENRKNGHSRPAASLLGEQVDQVR